MIYYPLSVLMLSEIRNIMIISTPQDLPNFKRLLGNGEKFGLRLEYAEQPTPAGIAQAFVIARDFIGNDRVCLILGDNVFYGDGLHDLFRRATNRDYGASIFGYHVTDPRSFGVIEFDKLGQAISIEEKPSLPKSNYVVTGVYFFDNQVVKIAENLKPSARGELEITDINNVYLEMGNLHVEIMGRGSAWFDSGTHEALLETSQFIRAIETRQGRKVACIEEIAFNKKWISKDELNMLAEELQKTEYGRYLANIESG